RRGAGVNFPAISLQIGGEHASTSVQIVALLTLLSLAPAILITLTAFVRIVIVLSFLRQAVGTQSMPPNQVIVSLALFLTFFVMLPTLREMQEKALAPVLISLPFKLMLFVLVDGWNVLTGSLVQSFR